MNKLPAGQADPIGKHRESFNLFYLVDCATQQPDTYELLLIT